MHLQRLYFQVRSESEVLGKHELGWEGGNIPPCTEGEHDSPFLKYTEWLPSQEYSMEKEVGGKITCLGNLTNPTLARWQRPAWTVISMLMTYTLNIMWWNGILPLCSSSQNPIILIESWEKHWTNFNEEEFYTIPDQHTSKLSRPLKIKSERLSQPRET